MRGFWDKLEKPIIGLSPMDGVTDAACRYITAKYGKPSFMMTEFTNVEGLARGAAKMMVAFLYDEIERPIVGQIYGVEVDSFYKCSVMLCAMGFDGIDINMGCPANNVAKRGSGAGLIQTPELAREIIRSCKKGAEDFYNGITLEKAGVHPAIIEELPVIAERKLVPVSVKTRIGYGEIVTESWISNLLLEKPANITLHGRTLKQMYMGKANWEEIAKAARICKEHGVSLLGNGDVESREDALKKIEEYGVDGVLIGRATFGNPWIFKGVEPTMEERMAVALEHARVFDRIGRVHFQYIKKHLGWYCKGFDGAKEMRKELMLGENLEDIEEVFKKFFYERSK